jgi:glycosyltransferase involved in cell wall biosynthesis
MTENLEPLISICCITYNHEKFIRDAIESFLMQKTDFPIEIIIRDDASTDVTADIIREFQSAHPDVIRVIYHAQNQYSLGKRAFPEVFKMARGKYIALCEGDDYWTDPLKLQKQVDFMEAHPECSICCHKTVRKYENSDKEAGIFPEITGNHIYSREYMYQKDIIDTCSALFVNEHMNEMIKFLEGFKLGDTPLWYFLCEHGKIGFLDECMAVYRKHDAGIYSSNSELNNLIDNIDTYEKIAERLKIAPINFSLYTRTMRVAGKYLNEGNFTGMRKYLKKSLQYFSDMNWQNKYNFARFALIAFFPCIYKIYSRRRRS